MNFQTLSLHVLLASAVISFAAPTASATPEGLHSQKLSNLQEQRQSSSTASVPQVETVSLAETPFLHDGTEAEIRQFIQSWGAALSPENGAFALQPRALTPFYYRLETLVAAKLPVLNQAGVVGISNPYVASWVDYIQQQQSWKLTPVMDSLVAYEYYDNMVSAQLKLEIEAMDADGNYAHRQIQAALMLEKQEDDWVIAQERIWDLPQQ